MTKAKDALTRRNAQEQKLVKLEKRKGKKITSVVWQTGYFQQVSPIDDWREKVQNIDCCIHRNWNVSRVEKGSAIPAPCGICFDRPLMPLMKCVFSTKNWNPSNLETHIKNCHNKDDTPGVFEDVN
jgi:hypothetical protein